MMWALLGTLRSKLLEPRHCDMRKPRDYRENPLVQALLPANVQPMASTSYQTWDWMSFQIIQVPRLWCVPTDTSWTWNDLSPNSWPNCRWMSKTNANVLSNSLGFGVGCHTHIARQKCNSLCISTKPNIHSFIPQCLLLPGFNLPS